MEAARGHIGGPDMLILKNCRLIPELTEGYDRDIADILIDGDPREDISRLRNNIADVYKFGKKVTL